MRHKDGFVRRGAAEALGKIGVARAVESLIQAFKYEHVSVQWRAAGALGKIGDARAVEPLIQALKDEDLRDRAASALGKIGKPAVESLIQALKDEDKDLRGRSAWALDELGWKPGNDTEKAHYLIAKGGWDELVKVGEPAVEPLIEALQDEAGDVRQGAALALGAIGDAKAVQPLIQALQVDAMYVRRKSAKALGEIGDLRAAGAIIDWLFGYPWFIGDPRELDSWIGAMKNLFGDYTALILKAASVKIEREITRKGVKYDAGKIHYYLRESDEAVSELCKVSTQISSNILHKVLQRKDIEVQVSWSCAFKRYGTLSFEAQREMAKKELKRRGNPPYDPSAYLNEEAWKL